MRSIATLIGIAAAIALARIGAIASEHIPPPVSLTMKLTDTNLDVFLMMQEDMWRHWLPDTEPTSLLDLDDAAFATCTTRVAEFLQQTFPVEADRFPVTPVVDGLDWQEDWIENDHINYVAVQLHYATRSKLRVLDFRWKRFDRWDEFPLEQVEATIEYFGDLRQYNFTEFEPQYLWRAPKDVRKPLPPRTFEVPPPPRWRLPVLSIALWFVAAGWLTSQLVRRRRRARLGLAKLAALVAAAAVGAGTLNVCSVEVDDPRTPTFTLPNEDDARFLFEGLQRNVYGAFDKNSESEIYDALALSVDGPLLDVLYAEVYNSLVQQEEGGAMSRVRGVKILDSTIEYPEESGLAHYDVDCRWRVTGAVEHWGHVHWRTNEYHARYRVALVDSHWKLTDVRILGQNRVPEESSPTGANENAGPR